MKSCFRRYGVLLPCLIILVYMICKASVLDLVWEIHADEASAWKTATLPQGAVQVTEADSQAELLRQSYFLVIPLIAGFLAALFIGRRKGWYRPSRKGLILGMASSCLLMGLHELLHGLAFPPGSTVYIGVIKSNLSGFAASTAPLSVPRCVVYYLLPAFVLGIMPLLFFLLSSEKDSAFCWFCYGFALIGLIQTAPDWFGLYPIIRQAPLNAVIQMSGWHTYWYIL